MASNSAILSSIGSVFTGFANVIVQNKSANNVFIVLLILRQRNGGYFSLQNQCDQHETNAVRMKVEGLI